ncbi:uncharacterized protein LOC127878947 [Dreissena polymorpha]|uniref:Uncharacterized protein n=1 Tax=Dreissena polymorpha TaxID=45954 RepID=A0A9D4KKL5_DREPO|nr:uncharacterized protein LOC127878947 [Dreissena polymorpha]KAH3841224.1 hypothetical protein DPMN_114682 [Dreissena polymorpha]
MYLRTILCFVFVTYSHSQGYRGRVRIVNKPFIGNQIQHDIGKAQVVGSELRHDTAKAVAVGQQLQHDVAKATIGGGLQPGFGPGGHIGIGSPILTNHIQHDIGKAQVVGGQLRHDTAKAATVGQQLEHDVAKATIGGGMQPGFGPVGLMGIAHGGMIPDDISSVIGSTIFGRPLTAGEMIGNVLLPRHGGTLNPDGIANGIGSVMPNGPHDLNDGWTDPLRGMPFPSDFNGQELVFDPNMNRYVIAPGSVGHQVAKATEHIIGKEANHIGMKTIGTNPVIGGMGHVNPIQHNIAKSMDDDNNHRIVKVSLGGGKSVQHNIAKATMG